MQTDSDLQMFFTKVRRIGLSTFFRTNSNTLWQTEDSFEFVYLVRIGHIQLPDI